jgi:succinoglycan biosynthesis transport protein ExoP
LSSDTAADTVTPQKVARILWRRKLVCLTVAALVIAAGLSILFTRPKEYQSTSSVALLPVSSNTGVLPNYPNLIASLIPTYVELVSSPALLNQVAATLPFAISPAQLAGQVHAESLSNAAVINIVAVNSSATRAQQIAARTTTVFLSRLSGNGVVTPQIYGEPTVPGTPASPNLKLILAAILIVAVLLGLAAGLVWDRLAGTRDDTSPAPADGPGPPVLAIVPELADGSATAALFTRANTDDTVDTEDTVDTGAALGHWRALRSTFAYLMAADQLRSVTVTSLYPGEGKTTVAVNLAASLAELGLSVVLVDAAIRDPSLHKIFGLGNDRGLTSAVTDQTDPASLLHNVPSIAGLKVVTAGAPLPAPIGENSPYQKQLAKFCSLADFVIVDGPALHGDIEAALAAGVTDAVILVTQAQNNPRAQAEEGSRILRQYRGAVLGTVLNRHGGPATDQLGRPDANGSRSATTAGVPLPDRPLGTA